MAAALIVSLVAGCAARPAGPSNSDRSAPAECNAVATAVAGALVGALIGGKNHRAGGAAVGAGLGAIACVTWNYQSRRIKSAQQVREEYRIEHAGIMPVETRVVRYESSLDEDGRVRAGRPLTIVSRIEVVQGTNASPPVIEESLTLHRPDGKDLVVRKKASDGNGAGAFTTSYSMTMPEGVQQGDYPIRTTLFIDGRAVANRDLHLQVVMGPHEERDPIAARSIGDDDFLNRWR